MLCEGLVNKAELLQVLISRKNGKSPVMDGFTAEFYKFFWVDIGTEILKSLNEAFLYRRGMNYPKTGNQYFSPKIINLENLLETNNSLECRIQITCWSLSSTS